MHLSEKGFDLIRRFEGLRLTAYLCPAATWSIGYGSTGSHVKPGLRISSAEADAMLRADVTRFESMVAAIAGKVTQGQFDALVSFAFNLGPAALSSSTLLKKHSAGELEGAAAEFGRWIYAGGRKLPGLVKRRAAEAEMYRS